MRNRKYAKYRSGSIFTTGTVAGRGRRVRWTPESDRCRYPMAALRRIVSVGITWERAWQDVGHGQEATFALEFGAIAPADSSAFSNLRRIVAQP